MFEYLCCVGIVAEESDWLPRCEMMSHISSLAALSNLGLRSSGPADVERSLLSIVSTAAGVNKDAFGLGQLVIMSGVRSGCF